MSQAFGPSGLRSGALLESLGALGLGAGKLFIVAPSGQSWVSPYTQLFPRGEVTTSLSAALDKVKAGRTDTVLVLPGEYTLTETLTVAKTCVITGLPGLASSTVITGPSGDGDDVLELSASGSDTFAGVVSHLTLIADAADRNGYALIIDSDDVTVRDCIFDTGDTACNSGIVVRDGVSNVSIEDCVFKGDGIGASDTLPTGLELDLDTQGITNVTAKGCKFQFCDYAVEAPTDSAQSLVNLSLEGCSILDSRTASLQLADGGAGTYSGFVIDCVLDVAIATESNIGAVGSLTFLRCTGTDGLLEAQPA